MLVPLAMLALGAVFAGVAFVPLISSARGAHEFWRGAIAAIAGNGRREGETCRSGSSWRRWSSPSSASPIAYYYYILHPDLPRKMAATQGLLYLFLYNKWYFDELYDFLFVRPALRLGRFLWKSGDGTVIDGLGPDGIAARVLDATRGAVRLQSGYVYHYALAMLLGVVGAGHLVHGGGRRAVIASRISRLVTFVPLLGARSPSWLMRQQRRANARAGSRWAPPSSTSSLSLVVWAEFDPSNPGFQLVEKPTGWAAASPITWAWTAFPCCSWC